VAGIRPDAPGFARVRLTPALGPLDRLSAVHPHPAGEIRVAYRRTGSSLNATVDLPSGVDGVLVWKGIEHALKGGAQQVLVLP
jgi:hypothetical protein